MSNHQTVTQGVVTSQGAIRPHQTVEKIALFNQDGTPFDVDGSAPTGADILLTGLTAGTATPVAATDSVNAAIAKLQAQIDAI